MKNKPIQIQEVSGVLYSLCSDGSIWRLDKDWVNIFSIERRKATEPKNDLEQRQADFFQDLVPFVDKYDKPMIRGFYNYWSEPSKSRKMRFEMESTWDIGRRLVNWSSRNGTNIITGEKKVIVTTPEFDHAKQSKIEQAALKRIMEASK